MLGGKTVGRHSPWSQVANSLMWRKGSGKPAIAASLFGECYGRVIFGSGRIFGVQKKRASNQTGGGVITKCFQDSCLN